ncbi:energy-coupling factor transporter transmembrane component T [Paenibacillus arenilitoris]|uniref:Energy-coupling factor transporter transmembrane protein EcfT n=1 Tax=Paenibacillus arenilitoris TaxID=2772299 RepID=A0A927CG63_9BACL|nr:energy-coupling factor transporter transmembrane component T [Paenibacillus arenilitoris]MBD2866955.1 energy-coupling factor transporter transmembrane protein EcfT [Paenibacillus arenilitoris]
MTAMDPRTHVIVLIASGILTFLATELVKVHMLVAVSALYLIWNGLLRNALYFVLAYSAMTALLPVIPDISAILGIILFTFSKMMPIAMVGAALLNVPPGRMMSALQRAYAPKPVVVMLCILVRFFPLLLLEFKAIRNGIRARGIFSNGHNALLHPIRAYECYFVPLIVRCLKLSSELAASAELRGIECDRVRTTIYPIGLTAVDRTAAGLYVLIGGMICGLGGIVQ